MLELDIDSHITIAFNKKSFYKITQILKYMDRISCLVLDCLV